MTKAKRYIQKTAYKKRTRTFKHIRGMGLHIQIHKKLTIESQLFGMIYVQ